VGERHMEVFPALSGENRKSFKWEESCSVKDKDKDDVIRLARSFQNGELGGNLAVYQDNNEEHKVDSSE